MVAFIGGIGGWEIVMILAIALVIFGPKRLPELARGLSKITAQIRQANRDIQREIYSNLDPEEIMKDEVVSPRAAAQHVESGEDEEGPTEETGPDEKGPTEEAGPDEKGPAEEAGPEKDS